MNTAIHIRVHPYSPRSPWPVLDRERDADIAPPRPQLRRDYAALPTDAPPTRGFAAAPIPRTSARRPAKHSAATLRPAPSKPFSFPPTIRSPYVAWRRYPTWPTPRPPAPARSAAERFDAEGSSFQIEELAGGFQLLTRANSIVADAAAANAGEARLTGACWRRWRSSPIASRSCGPTWKDPRRPLRRSAAAIDGARLRPHRRPRRLARPADALRHDQEVPPSLRPARPARPTAAGAGGKIDHGSTRMNTDKHGFPDLINFWQTIQPSLESMP